MCVNEYLIIVLKNSRVNTVVSFFVNTPQLVFEMVNCILFSFFSLNFSFDSISRLN